MNFNELYTALSGCMYLDDVHFNYTSKTFEKATPKKKIRLLKLKKLKKYFGGKIYMFTNKERTWIYIGSTCKELIQSTKKPVNKLMEELDLSDAILENVSCSTEGELKEHEDRYIEKYRSEGANVKNVQSISLKSISRRKSRKIL